MINLTIKAIEIFGVGNFNIGANQCNSCNRSHLYITWTNENGFTETVGAHMSSEELEEKVLIDAISGQKK